MPIHDWTRVRSNQFHDFHQSWTIAIRNALNAGRLPPGYFAMVEQKAGGPEADAITLELVSPVEPTPGGTAVALQPPKPWRSRLNTKLFSFCYQGVRGFPPAPLSRRKRPKSRGTKPIKMPPIPMRFVILSNVRALYTAMNTMNRAAHKGQST